ncbi:hypothetical protein EJ419_01075 [Alloscardovia theropitheci]|uniref:Uncharacterized protein n=1 Tax=Alloscardovia theropitheci TaxID=2496842 RepID=A0A4R0QRK9_9BIFI|nr:hypothetical protein [Alloscardovia theropitheci]TCD55012.1 hypothetical protein EJ419_01075 [Alloscardovia theropitheci]
MTLSAISCVFAWWAIENSFVVVAFVLVFAVAGLGLVFSDRLNDGVSVNSKVAWLTGILLFAGVAAAFVAFLLPSNAWWGVLGGLVFAGVGMFSFFTDMKTVSYFFWFWSGQ